MTIAVYPGQLNGTVNVPSSKSQLHRLIICASLAGGAEIKTVGKVSDDIAATVDCIESLGAIVRLKDDTIMVGKNCRIRDNAVLHCGESGSTLRFLLPIIAALGCGGHFCLDDGLKKRPHDEIIRILGENGCKVEKTDSVITVSGKLSGNAYTVRGDISSQYISGLIMALPLIGGGKITVTGGLQSEEYVRLTTETVRLFGCNAEYETKNTIAVSGNYTDVPISLAADSDDSLAAFWRAANELGSNIKITETKQPFYFPEVSEIDGSQIPDYVPIAALIASTKNGKTKFVNCARLRYKESDRIKSTVNLLNALGGKADENEDGFTVVGVPQLEGGHVDAENDHRIAMTAAIAAVGCKRPVVISGAEAVGKSYPSFFEDYVSVGGIIKEV